MKGLKEFLELLKEDKALFSEVEKVQDDSKKVVEIAKEHGYSFTEDEYNDLKMEAVSGGLGKADLMNLLKMGVDKGNDFVKSEDGKKTITDGLGKLGDAFKNLINKK